MSAPSKERTSLLDWAFDWAPDAPTGPSRYLSSLTKTAAVAGVGILGVVLIAGRNRRYEAQTQREWNWLKKNWGPNTRANSAANQTHARFEKEFKHPTDIHQKFHRDSLAVVERASMNADPDMLARLDIPLTEHMAAAHGRGRRSSKQKQHLPYNNYQELLIQNAATELNLTPSPWDEQLRYMKPFLTRMLVWDGKIQPRKSWFKKRRIPISRLKNYIQNPNLIRQIAHITKQAKGRAIHAHTKGIYTGWANNNQDFAHYVYELYTEQGGKCAVTGMRFEYDDAWLRPSVDRIDSSRGYYPQNIRLVLQCVNNLLNKHSDDMIVDLKMNNMTPRNLVTFRIPEYTINSSHNTDKTRNTTVMVNDGLITFPPMELTLAVKYKNQLDLYTKAPYNFEVVN